MNDPSLTLGTSSPRYRWLLLFAALCGAYVLVAAIVRYHRNKLPASVPSSPVTGVWHGVLTQRNPDGAYPVVIDLTNRERGTISYPTLHCTGTLTYENAVENHLQYREHVTTGRCQDGGNVRLDLGEDKLGFWWAGPGPKVFGTLSRLRPGETLPPLPDKFGRSPGNPLYGLPF